MCRPVQSRLAMRPQAFADPDTVVEEEPDHFGASVLARPGHAVLHLLRRGCRRQAAVRIEEHLDEIEPSEAGSAFEIQRHSTAREKLRRFWTSVRQAAVDEEMPAARAPDVDSRAICDQGADQR